jgi:urease accessory protein
MTALTALLLLADGRLPSGGHAHSGGVEAAVGAGRVCDLSTLEDFLRGRLATVGLVSAAFAAAGAVPGRDLSELDAGLDARTPSPALRRASRAQGRALLRAGRAMWPLSPAADGLHHPVALGVVAAAAGLSPEQAALAAAYGSVTGPATSAVRLLSLDPYPVHGVLARLAAECDRTAEIAASYAGRGVDALPAASAPLLDISAEAHATWEVRLFAS